MKFGVLFFSFLLVHTSAFSSTPASATPLPPLEIHRTFSLDKGENLPQELMQMGFNRTEVYRLLSAVKKKQKMNRLPLGQKFTLVYQEKEERKAGPIEKFKFHTTKDQTITATLQNGEYKAKRNSRELQTNKAVAIGKIDGSLYASASRANLPTSLVPSFANLFAWELDFTRDIRPGDAFKVVYEEIYDDDGNFVRNGNILAANLHSKGKQRYAYRAEYAPGRFSYYDEKGYNKKRMLLRTPLEFSRISSHFNPNRKHPVLGYTRAHKGTDFAAPTGTPIKAAGDGRIEEAKWWGSFGRYVRIKHNNTYKTAYAHLHKFGRGIKKGKRVKQGDIIGYVGSTGRSTGPHLHFEIHKKGKQVNPMRVRLPNGAPLPKGKKKHFQQQMLAFNELWDVPVKVAANTAK